MAAKLILSLDGMVIREYPLTKERTTLGRKAHNDIVIDNLAISGEHAMIMTILNDSFLEDLGSTNGTLVNGQPIKKHFLQNNDVVELGKYKLKYLSDAAHAAAAPPSDDFEKTMVLRPAAAGGAKPETPKAEATKQESAPAKTFSDTVVNPEMMQSSVSSTGQGSFREAARQAVAAGVGGAQGAAQPAIANQAPSAAMGTIQILSGPSAGKELPLSKPLTTLGKPGVQVAVIAKRPQGYFITHVEGVSFPMVNGKQLDAQAHALSDHDVIELAGVKMEFFLKPAA